MFSRRTNFQAPLNRLTTAREERRRSGGEIFDLTVSNPTLAGIPYPLDELAEAMARGARAPYDPQPLGLRSAREAVAAELHSHPDDVVITASTSEAYSFLFKLLTEPGDEIAIAVPSYPLLEHLASMEMVTLRSFPLELHRRWEMTEPEITERTRAVVVVNPNNPTGSFVPQEEMALVAKRPLIVDEVFLDYPVDGGRPGSPPEGVLAFSLGGLSKSAGLPHYKLGWIRVTGPEAQRRAAIDALEMIADNFLSVATPVQVALPDLLRIGSHIRAAVLDRVRSNLQLLRAILARRPSISVLPVEGGWSATVRVPATMSDEESALALVERGVVVHPGYFFDFPTDGFLVISLLTAPEVLSAGLQRLLEVISE
jgi:aspartate/methionine/tyrosine aminotransferase